MKKGILNTVLFSFLLVPMLLVAQDFQGKAYYQTKIKIDLKIEDSHMDEDQQKMMQEMLRKQFEKTYVLTFNKEASVYKEEEKLDKPKKASAGMQVILIGGSSAGEKFYKNIKSKTYTREQNLLGKLFLVKDELEPYEWKLEDESKIIGKYLCFKATAVREVKIMDYDSEITDKKGSEDIKEEVENQVITAWYTTDIPVSHGPDDYWGLPGLILELNVDKTQYVCTKIVMNSKDKAEIKAPSKGKVINQEKYAELMEKKMKEMQKNRGRERKGNGNSINIKIRG